MRCSSPILAVVSFGLPCPPESIVAASALIRELMPAPISASLVTPYLSLKESSQAPRSFPASVVHPLRITSCSSLCRIRALAWLLGGLPVWPAIQRNSFFVSHQTLDGQHQSFIRPTGEITQWTNEPSAIVGPEVSPPRLHFRVFVFPWLTKCTVQGMNPTSGLSCPYIRPALSPE